MAEALRFDDTPLGRMMSHLPSEAWDFESHERRLLRKERKRTEEEQRRQETMARLAAERRAREQRQAAERKDVKVSKPAHSAHATRADASVKSAERPLPPVPVRIEFPEPAFQGDNVSADRSARLFSARARRALVGFQPVGRSALPAALPHRAAGLPVADRPARAWPAAGPRPALGRSWPGQDHRGRLVLKELLTRGMVKKFLVLTVPSLVDQWQEELSDKFGLTTVTTNEEAARDDPQTFWRENAGLVASLHTLKQPAHLEIAKETHWDLLIVDEAHYLRNRESQAWQAVNALPRQFLLLLTATPVQNSLEELYNLVTLLQPGQLPSPKEFRARFMDPKRPRQPREPEELRRLLGQVMIRNTRANAGLKLPPRRAETVLFEPDAPSARSGSNGKRTSARDWQASAPVRPAFGAGCCCRRRAAARRRGGARWRNFPIAPPPEPGARKRRWKQVGNGSATCSSRSPRARAAW